MNSNGLKLRHTTPRSRPSLIISIQRKSCMIHQSKLKAINQPLPALVDFITQMLLLELEVNRAVRSVQHKQTAFLLHNPSYFRGKSNNFCLGLAPVLLRFWLDTVVVNSERY